MVSLWVCLLWNMAATWKMLPRFFHDFQTWERSKSEILAHPIQNCFTSSTVEAEFIQIDCCCLFGKFFVVSDSFQTSVSLHRFARRQNPMFASFTGVDSFLGHSLRGIDRNWQEALMMTSLNML